MFKNFLLTVLTAFSLSSFAALQATSPDGDITVVITEAPCTNATVLSFIPEKLHPFMVKLDTTVSGHHQEACGYGAPSALLVKWDDGDEAVIPWSEFKEKGV